MEKVTIEKEIERFSPSIKMGLSSSQVEKRIKEKCVNISEKKLSKTYFSIFFTNIFTFFNLLGLIVTISLIIVEAPLSSFFFDLIYCSNILIGIIQEIRSKITIEKLSLISNKTTKVIREGETKNIQSNEIVLDDIVLLSCGNQIPTDCKIIEGCIEVNEALLTGESVAVKKSVNDTLFAGSYVVSGSCTVLANKVGKDNYISELSAKAKKYKKPHSEIISSLFLIIKFISFIIVPIAILYITKGLIKDQELTIIIRRTSSVVIGMIPSGMMLLTSMALAVGVIKLSRHNTLVQDLYSLETLARVDTICFDKTGTITDGKMTVSDIVNLTDNNDINVSKIISNMLNNFQDTNQTSKAMIDKFGTSNEIKATAILPFNSKRKFCAVTFENEGTFAFGASEFILNKENFSKIEQSVNQYANMGIRVILLAHANSEIKDDKINNDFYPIALILIKDNIRKEAFSTVQWFNDNDVDIKVISGDNPMTVAEVSKRVGIKNADKFISLEGLTDDQVYEVANKYTVFGRVSPEQKAILVKSMKFAGHTVAMTGDGVNDILAMKEADCAVTVASGSEATKNVANLVLTDNNFNSMPTIVQEGRRVINNVQSSASLYIMKTMFTVMLSFIFLCIPSVYFYPYELPQMILLEVCIIGLPSFFLSLQPNDARVSGKFIAYIIRKSLPSALLMVISVLLVKFSALFVKIPNENLTSTVEVFAFTFAGIISLFQICRPFNRYRVVLFTISTAVICFIFAVTFFAGLSILSYSSFLPLGKNIYQIIAFIVIIFIEVPLSILLQNLCSKVNFSKIKLKRKENI